ncbi:MAG: EAL domain-containing protein [Candidatus Dormibacteria bacterium]
MDRHVFASEALLRWTHPMHGNISPSAFLPIAEQSGLIISIGAWVMDQACRDHRHLQRTHKMDIAVNVSIRQLAAGGFVPGTAAEPACRCDQARPGVCHRP